MLTLFTIPAPDRACPTGLGVATRRPVPADHRPGPHRFCALHVGLGVATVPVLRPAPGQAPVSMPSVLGWVLRQSRIIIVRHDRRRRDRVSVPLLSGWVLRRPPSPGCQDNYMPFLCPRYRAGSCDPTTILWCTAYPTKFLCPRCRAGVLRHQLDAHCTRQVSMPSVSGWVLRRPPLLVLVPQLGVSMPSPSPTFVAPRWRAIPRRLALTARKQSG